ncbi:MAG: DUF393 domain-containing protein [Candidatus Zixiibacteriota bacterium]|nr:MAG: DUF393 domain-containing protein [candidate division Zixibacteria bacterium]
MGQYHVIYDDNCPLCLAAIGQVRQLDRLGLVNLVALSDVTGRAASALPAHRKLLEQMHLVTPEGRVYRGADAVGVLARVLPKSRYIGNFILLPGVRQLARIIYRLIARHRLSVSRLCSLN